MAAKKNSKFENKFRGTAASESRTANVRDERKVKDEQPKLSFNFKDFDFNQCPPGQTLEKWQEEKMLDKLVGRFVEVRIPVDTRSLIPVISVHSISNLQYRRQS